MPIIEVLNLYFLGFVRMVRTLVMKFRVAQKCIEVNSLVSIRRVSLAVHRTSPTRNVQVVVLSVTKLGATPTPFTTRARNGRKIVGSNYRQERFGF